MLFMPAQVKPKSFDLRWNFLFYLGWMRLIFTACLGTRLLLQLYQYPNLLEGADHTGGQLCGDKECPFSDVTKSGRVWRKVPESDARSVPCSLALFGGIIQTGSIMHRMSPNLHTWTALKCRVAWFGGGSVPVGLIPEHLNSTETLCCMVWGW